MTKNKEISKVKVKLVGGLGNQMFCYAAGYALARKRKSKLMLDTSYYYDSHDNCGRKYELNKFNINIDRNDTKGYENIFVSGINKIKDYFIYHQINELRNTEVDTDKDIMLTGFNQRYELFDEYKEDIKRELSLKHYSDNLVRVIEKYKNSNTVSLHLRFGDYVKIGCVVDDNYYYSALNKLISLIGNYNVILVFSEDINKAKDILKAYADKCNFVYIDDTYKLSDIEQFELMKQCNHHIISNSTYSWWAAYLNDEKGYVIAPEVNGWLEEYWKEKYFPKDWILIDTILKNEKEI